MKSLMVHYKNKYHGAVQCSDDAMDVFNKAGDHVVALRKNGAGQWTDQSESMGCSDKHCLSPIPKEARVFKVIDGKITKDEKAAERMEMAEGLLQEFGKVPSCEELSKLGFEFDEKQKMTKAPKA